MSADKAWRALGFATELAAIGAAGLLELLSPRDKSGEYFAGAAASLADENDSPGVLLRPSVSEGKQEPVSGDACCNASGPHTTSQPSPVTTRTSAGDRSAAAGSLPPTVAAEPLDEDAADLQAFADAIPFGWASIDVGELIAEAQAELADWLKPAILDVLAEHTFRPGTQACSCYFDDLDLAGRMRARHMDEGAWREHVADDLAPHIVKALRAQPK